jgi:signal transduction histidine kinase
MTRPRARVTPSPNSQTQDERWPMIILYGRGMSQAEDHVAASPPCAGNPSRPIVDSGIVHDLLNPLTSILGNLHLLTDRLKDAPPDVLKCLSAGVVSSEELRDMLENLRYLMSPQAASAVSKRIDLAAMAGAAVQDAADRLTEKPAPNLHPGEGPVWVAGREKLLRRMLDVLLRAAMRLGTSCEIELASVGASAAELRFVHRGRGIPAELAEHLFEPDFPEIQYDRGYKIDRARGFFFARCVARVHGGSIRYEPRTDGGAFVVQLPCDPAGR